LYRNTLLRGTTRSVGIWDRLLIRLSVMPSLRYSSSGLPLALPNGITASESIAAELSTIAVDVDKDDSLPMLLRLNARSRAD
jgi:hypothetical protein